MREGWEGNWMEGGGPAGSPGEIKAKTGGEPRRGRVGDGEERSL